MADGALAGLDPQQRERLQAMGYELYELRRTAEAAPADAPAAVREDAVPAAARTPPAARPVRLCVPGVDLARPERLLLALLRVVGVGPDEISGDIAAGVPSLGFGDGITAEVQAPDLHALRSAAAKRALWPALRRLRRRLADASSPG